MDKKATASFDISVAEKRNTTEAKNITNKRSTFAAEAIGFVH